MFKGYVLKSNLVERAKETFGDDVFDEVFKEMSNKHPASLLNDYYINGETEKENCLRMIFLDHPDLLKI